VTPGSSRSAASDRSTPAFCVASVSLPSLVVKTTWLWAPAAAGNFVWSRSSAFCDSVPGTEKSCAALPLWEPTATPTTTMVRTRPARPRFQCVVSERARAARRADIGSKLLPSLQICNSCRIAVDASCC
jgi:hypothetical protein